MRKKLRHETEMRHKTSEFKQVIEMTLASFGSKLQSMMMTSCVSKPHITLTSARSITISARKVQSRRFPRGFASPM